MYDPNFTECDVPEKVPIVVGNGFRTLVERFFLFLIARGTFFKTITDIFFLKEIRLYVLLH